MEIDELSSCSDFIRLLRPAIDWLRRLPPHHRREQAARLYELGEDAYADLVDLDGRERVWRATESLSSFAESCLDDAPRILPSFARLVRREPRLVELGLLVHAAALSRARRVPRDQGMYAAILLNQLVASIRSPGDPALRLVWELVARSSPDDVAAVRAAAAAIQERFGPDVSWPTESEAANLRRTLGVLHPEWHRVASALHDAVSPAPARLGWDTIVQIARDPSRIDELPLRRLLDEVNEPPRRPEAERRLRRTLGWPAWADAILANLERDPGWLRLHLAFLSRVWSSLLAHAATRPTGGVGAEGQHPLSAFAAVLERDLVYPLAVGVDDLHGESVAIFSVRSLHGEEGREDALVQRKRLQRQREACLSGGALDVTDDEIIDLVADLANVYFASE